MKLVAAFAFLAAIALPHGAARAERREWHLSVGAIGVNESIASGGSEGTQRGIGGQLRIARGIGHSFELGASVRIAGVTAIPIANAMIGVQPGTLYVNSYSGAVTVDARWIGGVDIGGLFERTHPVIGIAAGVAAVAHVEQDLLDDMNQRVLSLDDNYALHPLLGVDVGIEHRFGAATMLGVFGSYTRVGDDQSSVAVRCEAGVLWY